jgi:hypothetical protein
VSVVFLPIKVSVASGIVNVLSAVGLVTDKIISKAFVVDPSNVIEESDKYKPETVGDVKVLFVKVCDPVVLTTVIPST